MPGIPFMFFRSSSMSWSFFTSAVCTVTKASVRKVSRRNILQLDTALALLEIPPSAEQLQEHGARDVSVARQQRDDRTDPHGCNSSQQRRQINLRQSARCDAARRGRSPPKKMPARRALRSEAAAPTTGTAGQPERLCATELLLGRYYYLNTHVGTYHQASSKREKPLQQKGSKDQRAYG
eukprot:6212293-Pleurochrysis_carterae.AAC.2